MLLGFKVSYSEREACDVPSGLYGSSLKSNTVFSICSDNAGENDLKP